MKNKVSEKLKGAITMLHPSYADLMQVLNSDVEPGEQPVVNSRYSVVLATAKRARQIVDHAQPLTENPDPNPVTQAVQEIYEDKITYVSQP